MLNGHFLWHELYAKVIALTGSSSTIVHKSLAEMTDEEEQAKRHLAQTWLFDDTRLRQTYAYEPRFSIGQTLRDAVT